uniref:Reverse transcriptase zinc-binding domain-containing protein n=1 Tax=Oryza meridionalis TaxID=40149 RepID=A0A0E0DQW0_9ORYZ
MAELLSALLPALLKKAGESLSTEFSFIGGIERHRSELYTLFLAINQVIADAEEQAPKKPVVKSWITKLKLAACDADDALDELQYEALRSEALRSGHKINSGPMNVDQRITHSYVDRDEVIGRDKDRDVIIHTLLSAKTNEFLVLPIVGIGGLGKTTLAKLVFNDEKVKAHFQKHIWVCVLEEFNVPRIIKSIIDTAIGNDCGLKNDNLELLQQRLREELSRKKFLLVLDDIWNEDELKWETLRALFGSCGMGSAVLVTTRNSKVASVMGTVHPFDLEGLSSEHSWDLFDKKVFGPDLVESPKLVEIVCLSGDECFTLLDLAEMKKIPKNVHHMVFPHPYKIDFVMHHCRIIRSIFALRDSPVHHVKVLEFKKSTCRVIGLKILWNVRLSVEPAFMKHLRYLDLSGSGIKELPEGTSALYNLQTLMLNRCGMLNKLPEDMKYMTSLRHVYLDRCSSLRSMPVGIRHLIDLRTLTRYVVRNDSGCGIEELKYLKLGGKLHIFNLNEVIDPLNAREANIEHKQNLQELALCWRASTRRTFEDGQLYQDEEILGALKPPNGLKVLKLRQYMGIEYPTWMEDGVTLQNIVKLSLTDSIKCIKLPPVWHLPFLEVLKLKRMRSLKYLCSNFSRDNGCGHNLVVFPKLKLLSLVNMGSLENWQDHDVEQAMPITFPTLDAMKICGCPKLTTLPNVPLLKSLSVVGNKILLGVATKLTDLSYLYLGASQGRSLRVRTLYYEQHGELQVQGNTDPKEHIFADHLLPWGSLTKLHLQGFSTLAPQDMQNRSGPMMSVQNMDLTSCDCFIQYDRMQSPLWFWKSFACLGHLHINYCDSLSFWPHEELQSLTSLKKLFIRNCKNFTGVQPARLSARPSTDKGPCNLECLQIDRCPNLVVFPTNFSCLRILDITDSNVLEGLPEGLGCQGTLTTLAILGCPSLSSLPASIRCLSNLTSLELASNNSVTALPEGMQNLTALKRLHISCPGIKALPEGLQQRLHGLERFSIRDCPDLARRCKRGGDYWDKVKDIPNLVLTGRILSAPTTPTRWERRRCGGIVVGVGASGWAREGDWVRNGWAEAAGCGGGWVRNGGGGNSAGFGVSRQIRRSGPLPGRRRHPRRRGREMAGGGKGGAAATALRRVAHPSAVLQIRARGEVGTGTAWRPAGGGVAELKDLKLGGKLHIRGLEVTNPLDAKEANLESKQNLHELAVRWCSPSFARSPVNFADEDSQLSCAEEVLNALKPPNKLKVLNLKGYMGSRFPTWMEDGVTLPNIVKLSLAGCKMCVKLPPVWQLPFLEVLRLKQMNRLKYLCSKFSDKECGHQILAFPKLKLLSLYQMESLEQWQDLEHGVEQVRPVTFPELDAMEVIDCPNLTFLPNVPMLKLLSVTGNKVLLNLALSITNLSYLYLGASPGSSWRARTLCYSYDGGREGSTDTKEEHILPKHLLSWGSLTKLHLQGFNTPAPENVKSRSGHMMSVQGLVLASCDCFIQHEGLQSPLWFWKSFGCLQRLEIRYCDSLTFWPEEEFRSLTSLEKLFIRNCKNFTGVPPGRLSARPSTDGGPCNLEYLQIDLCPNLMVFPTNFSCLRILVITYSNVLEGLPGGLGCHSTLTTLVILGCPSFSSLPASIRCLSNLKSLELASNNSLTSLPEGMQNLTALKTLHFIECPGITALPEGLQQRLHGLQIFTVEDCPALARRCRRGGDYWEKVKDIPDLRVTSRVPFQSEPIWKTFAPPRCRFFAWLVAKRRCWTADRLRSRGLPHPDRCVLCDQHEETIDHILVACPESRQLWWVVLSSIGLPQCLPLNEDSFYLWLCNSRLKVGAASRRGFDTIATLTAWTIWKERNNRVFNSQQRPWSEIARAMAAEATLWRLAHAALPHIQIWRPGVLKTYHESFAGDLELVPCKHEVVRGLRYDSLLLAGHDRIATMMCV